MSYCVHCGVELSKGVEECPLCNTPVINPSELEKLRRDVPFPEQKGVVETVKRKDMGIFISVMLLTTAITCGILNAFIFTMNLWSLAVIGACGVIWVLLIPLIIYSKISGGAAICLDGLAVAVYLFLIARMGESFLWFYKMGLPTVVLGFVILELMYLCSRFISKSFLAVAMEIITGLGVFCIGLDLLIDLFLKDVLSVSWSAIVMTVCVVLDAGIIVILSSKRLRGAVRRRFHL